MFVQLAMFAGLAQSGRRDLSEPECGMIMRLRGYVETEDWNSAVSKLDASLGSDPTDESRGLTNLGTNLDEIRQCIKLLTRGECRWP